MGGLTGACSTNRIIPPEPVSTRKAKAQKGLENAVAAAAVAAPGIPVEFTEDDLGSRLDDMFLGPVSPEQPEDKAEIAPKNGTVKRRSLRSLFGLSPRGA